ncbi:ArsR/SmtB family transcription factor [Nonomuraea ferruginea]
MLGRTRTRLLAELDQPASTRELAARLDLSEPGANQHLTALRRAGLASAHRTGRYVLYARTAVAETLLARRRESHTERSRVRTGGNRRSPRPTPRPLTTRPRTSCDTRAY